MLLFVTMLRIYGTRVKLIAIGVGERFSLFDKILYSLAFHGVDEFIVRDEKSKKIYDEFLRESHVCPDIAYFMTHSTLHRKQKMIEDLFIAPVEFSVHTRYAHEMG